MNKLTKMSISVALTMSIAMPVFSANNGASPNGKPFIELNGKVVEVQNDIVSLQTQLDDFKKDVDVRFDTLDGKISAIDLKISDLETKDSALTDELNALAQTVAGTSAEIDGILTTISSLNDQITKLESDIRALEQASDVNYDLIKANEAEIETLRTDIQTQYNLLAGQIDGVVTILAQKLDINEFISQLNQFKLDVEQQLALKQDIINAGCSDGEFLTNLQPDGSFDCNAPAALANGVTRTTRYGPWVTAHPAYWGVTGSYQQSYSCGIFGLQTCYRTVYTYGWIYHTVYSYVYCPSGHLRASMSSEVVQPSSGHIYSYVQAYGTEGARTTATNYSTNSSGQVRTVVTCFGVNP